MAGQPGPASALCSSSAYVGHGAGAAAPLKNDTQVILKGHGKWQDLQAGPTGNKLCLWSRELASSLTPQTFVGAVRICKVTGTRQPELQGRGFVVPGKNPFQMEGELLGSAIEILHQCFNFLLKCCVLLKKMLFVSPSFRSEVIYGNRALSLLDISGKRGCSFQWKAG